MDPFNLMQDLGNRHPDAADALPQLPEADLTALDWAHVLVAAHRGKSPTPVIRVADTENPNQQVAFITIDNRHAFALRHRDEWQLMAGKYRDNPLPKHREPRAQHTLGRIAAAAPAYPSIWVGHSPHEDQKPWTSAKRRPRKFAARRPNRPPQNQPCQGKIPSPATPGF